MRRMALVILLGLSGAAVARADNDLYNNVLKQPRGDDALHADTAICDAQLGAPQNGTATSRPYKRCMLTHGWRFEGVMLVRDGVVLFRNHGGQPNIELVEDRRNPLGPLQNAGESGPRSLLP